MLPLRSWLFLVLHVLPLAIVTGGSVGGIATCDAQYNCLKATLSPSTSGPSCGSCTYKLCLEIDYRSGCAKSSTVSTSGISHVCKKSENVCSGNYTGFAGASRVESGIYDNGPGNVFTMCQYGEGGQMLNFLMKDASSDCSPLSNQVNILGLENTGASTSCTSLTSLLPAIQGCGGNTNIWKTECVWTIKLPQCAAAAPAALPAVAVAAPAVAVAVAAPAAAQDCVWNPWTAWGACTQSCGGGTRTRSRTKQTEASNGGSCPGASTEDETCNTQSCGAGNQAGGKTTTPTVISANTACTDFLNGGVRQCCPTSGSCQDSSCTVFGFPNSAKANCQTGPNSNCPESYCRWKVGDCPESAENHCYGTVACIDEGEECYGYGELCLQDGNSNNFKICAASCKNDRDCPSGSKCDRTQDPSQCVVDTSATSTTSGTTTVGTATVGTIAVETTTGGTTTGETTTGPAVTPLTTPTTESEEGSSSGKSNNGKSNNGKSNNGKKVRTGWPEDRCDEPVDDSYPEFEEGDGVACSFSDVLDLLKDFDCKIPKSSCNECVCDTPLPPDVLAQLKACAVLNDYNPLVEKLIDAL